MANDLTRYPWLVDSTGLVKSGKTKTTGFVFRDYTAGGTAIIKDSRNKVICRLTGNPGLTPVSELWFTPTWVNDMLIDATSSLNGGVIEVIVD